MNEREFFCKELAQTGTSFFQRTGFQYRNKERTIDYGLLREDQKIRIKNLFKLDPFFNEDKLEQQYEKIESENHQFIQSLLQQLACEVKKNRNIQSDYENQMREKITQNRKLCEKILNITSQLQIEKKQRQIQRSKYDIDSKSRKQKIKEIYRQSHGLRLLLNQYEKELQMANQKIQKQQIMLRQKTDAFEFLLIKLEQYEQKINIYEQKITQDAYRRHIIQEDIEKYTTLQTQFESLKQQICSIKLINKQLQDQIINLKSTQNQKDKLIQHYEMQILKINGQLVKQSQNYENLKYNSTYKSQQLSKKEYEWKNIIFQLQSKTKIGLNKLKQNYDKKIKKLISILQKQIKQIKISYINMKQTIQKQFILFIKLNQRDFRDQIRNITILSN